MRAAMARWPDVPAVFGWLRLDRRGGWWLVQRDRPDFDVRRDGRGSPITGAVLSHFIARNYACDADGRWFFQNGPQRVFVDLELAPLVFRVDDAGARLLLVAHTGTPAARIDRVLLDTQGNVFVATDLGPGVIDDRQLVRIEPRLQQRPQGWLLAIDRDRPAAGIAVEIGVADPAGALGFVTAPR